MSAGLVHSKDSSWPAGGHLPAASHCVLFILLRRTPVILYSGLPNTKDYILAKITSARTLPSNAVMFWSTGSFRLHCRRRGQGQLSSYWEDCTLEKGQRVRTGVLLFPHQITMWSSYTSQLWVTGGRTLNNGVIVQPFLLLRVGHYPGASGLQQPPLSKENDWPFTVTKANLFTKMETIKKTVCNYKSTELHLSPQGLTKMAQLSQLKLPKHPHCCGNHRTCWASLKSLKKNPSY